MQSADVPPPVMLVITGQHACQSCNWVAQRYILPNTVACNIGGTAAELPGEPPCPKSDFDFLAHGSPAEAGGSHSRSRSNCSERYTVTATPIPRHLPQPGSIDGIVRTIRKAPAADGPREAGGGRSTPPPCRTEEHAQRSAILMRMPHLAHCQVAGRPHLWQGQQRRPS